MTVMSIFLLLILLQFVFSDRTEVEIIPAVLIHEEHQYEIHRGDSILHNNNFRFNPSNFNSNNGPQFKPLPAVLNEKWPKPNSNVEPPPRVPIEPLVSKYHPIDSRPPSGLKPPSNNRNNEGQHPSRFRSRPTTSRSAYRPIDSRIPAGLQPPPSQDLQTSDRGNDRSRDRHKMRTYYPQTTKQPFLPMNLQNVNFYFPQTTIGNILNPIFQNTYSENRRPNSQQAYVQPNNPSPFKQSSYPHRNQNRRPNHQRPMPQQPNSAPYGPRHYLPNKPIKIVTTDSEPLGVSALNHALITVLYENKKTTRFIRNTNGVSTYKIFAAKYLETTTLGPPYQPKLQNRNRNIEKSRKTTEGDMVTRRDEIMVKNLPETSVPRAKYKQKPQENTQNRKRKNNPPRVISSQSFQIQN